MIPKQLSNLKFCRIKKRSKAPFEKDWPNKTYSYEEISNFQNENYGVLCGYKDLAVIDCDRDELSLMVSQMLPKTFSVKTGGGGFHYYYFVPELKKKIILNAGEEHLGEIQSVGTQVVGAGSIHPNGNEYEVVDNVGIKEISLVDLKKVVGKFMEEEVEEATREKKKETGEITKKIIKGINFEELLIGYGLEKKGENWNCPFHKSIGGQCLSVDKERGIFNCFHCGWKGNIISFVSKIEDITIKKALEKLNPKDKNKGINVNSDFEAFEFKKIYKEIVNLLKYYCDLNKDDYPLIAIWIIGTYFHDCFYSYPYLFFNAMKGSGKSRVMNLIKTLSKNGEKLTSVTEATLFRERGTLCIDEFEAMGKKGNENLRELLNTAYKKGGVVKRMRKVSGKDGEKQEVEKFEVYRPIIMANIWGLDEVLGDRCIEMILEKSSIEETINLTENFDNFSIIMEVLELISKGIGSVGSVKHVFENTQNEWNEFTKPYISIISITSKPSKPSKPSILLFNKIKKTKLDGRSLELFLPLFLLADKCGVLNEILKVSVEITKKKKEGDLYEGRDVMLYDFISQLIQTNDFIKVSELNNQFKAFLGSEEKDKWPNTWWVGLALKRLKLIREKKRSNGMMVLLNYDKAKEKIGMFKEPEEKQEEIKVQKIGSSTGNKGVKAQEVLI